MTNEELGQKIKESREKHKEEVRKMTPKWQSLGIKYRNLREHLGISQKKIAELVGACEEVIGRLEAGKDIQRRPVIETSYITALKVVQLEKDRMLSIFSTND